eukprot:TRINITY_DN29748_c0_g1_i1.p1 TRINITY_DN29748_c0_g1~~TRINITY_DN29748_c0_g1_i1.p1  ORF type:complete len:460 (+),score=62.05 TRINITY_DN29748_c0_g1_i1:57-1436(+)
MSGRRAGSAHYHQPGRPSPNVIAIKRRLSASRKVPRHPVVRQPTPETVADLEVDSINKASDAVGIRVTGTEDDVCEAVRVPTPPTVDGILRELKKGRGGQRAVRQIKMEYHARIAKDVTLPKAADIDILDFVTPGKPDVGTDTPNGAVTGVTPLFEVELLEQVEWVNRHRTQHPETPNITRLSRCLGLLGKIRRVTKGAVAEFLKTLHSEVLDAVFLTEYAQRYLVNNAAEHPTHTTYHWQFMSLSASEAKLEQENVVLRAKLDAATTKAVELENALNSEGLCLLKKQLEELETVHSETKVKLQRQKDHSDFLNSQIDELQDALKKAAERSYTAVKVRQDEAGSKIKEIIMQSDAEIHTILGFSDPAYEKEGFDQKAKKKDLHVNVSFRENQTTTFGRSGSSISLIQHPSYPDRQRQSLKSPRHSQTPTSVGSLESSFHASEVSLTWQEPESNRGSTSN